MVAELFERAITQWHNGGGVRAWWSYGGDGDGAQFRTAVAKARERQSEASESE